jgi:hypothetical protein
MSATDAGTRPLSDEEKQIIEAARKRAETLYLGKEIPHHGCGAALAVTFDLPCRPYQALRRGGITGERFCGSIRGGEIVLGDLLGDPDPRGKVTASLRAAVEWYQAQVPSRFPRGDSPDYICNNIVAQHGDFFGAERLGFCTGWTGEVAALTAEALLRFAPELDFHITGSTREGGL